jgi:hypothetical protein
VEDRTSVNQLCYGMLTAITNTRRVLEGHRENPQVGVVTSWNKSTNRPPGYESIVVRKLRATGNTFFAYNPNPWPYTNRGDLAPRPRRGDD